MLEFLLFFIIIFKSLDLRDHGPGKKGGQGVIKIIS